MGFRYHRSIQVIPGLRLNMSKSGFGLSAGFKGYHVSRSPGGRRRRTISIPGTGMSWIDYSKSGGSSTAHRSAATSSPQRAPRTTTRATSEPPPAPVTPAAPGHPGVFAPKAEKALYAAVSAGNPDAVEQIANSEHSVALAAATLCGIMRVNRGDDTGARRDLQWVFDTGSEPGSDHFVKSYTALTIHIEVTDGVSVTVPISRDAVGLLLAELYGRAEPPDLAKAIEVIHSLPRTTLTALSLADLLDQTGQFDEVIDVTEDAPNTDDATSLLWVFRGIAFRETGAHDAALECFAKVTRCRSRNPAVLHRARFERARCYAAMGKKAQARKDLGVIQAEDPSFGGVTEALAELDTEGH